MRASLKIVICQDKQVNVRSTPYCSIYRYCKCLKPAFGAEPAQDRDFSCARFHIVLDNGLLSYNFAITVSIDTVVSIFTDNTMQNHCLIGHAIL